MTDEQNSASNTVESVVHSYTQAELALTEVTGAVERFRNASEQLSTATAQNTEAVQALRTATTASLEVAERLEGVIAGLGNVSSALSAVDPERLWAHLESEKARQEAAEEERRREASQIRWIAVAAATAAVAAVLLLLMSVGTSLLG